MPDISPSDTSTSDFIASLEADLAGGSGPADAPATDAGQAPDDKPVADGGGQATAPEGYVTKEQYDNLQSLMGRMSNELGELRQQLQPQPEPEPEVYTSPVTEQIVSEIEEAIQRQGGEAIAQWALVNRPDLYEVVLDVWADSGIPGAARRSAAFDINTRMEIERLEREAQAEKEYEASRESIIDERVSKIAPEFGFEAGSPELDALLTETLTAAPDFIKERVVSRDARESEEAIRLIYSLAKAKAGPAAPAADPAAVAAALAAGKGQASLGAGGLQRTPDAPGTEQSVADAFHELIMGASRTSVAEGLTFGQ